MDLVRIVTDCPPGANQKSFAVLDLFRGRSSAACFENDKVTITDEALLIKGRLTWNPGLITGGGFRIQLIFSNLRGMKH